MKWPKKILMVDPQFFDVKYAINAHMTDSSGKLNPINKNLAYKQWKELKETFASLDLEVSILPGQEDLPDMVFSANQTFPLYKENSTQFILSKMNSQERAPEVKLFNSWAIRNNLKTINLETKESFEGMGDLLWNYETEELYGGYGFRTSSKSYIELEKKIGLPIHQLKLISEDFYHLDTCLAIANKSTAFFVKNGFDKASLKKLENNFSNLIEIPYKEAKENFAANLCCINGTDIVIQKGSAQTVEKAKQSGFKVHEVETSEFMKSGGSVFCMKQMYW